MTPQLKQTFYRQEATDQPARFSSSFSLLENLAAGRAAIRLGVVSATMASRIRSKLRNLRRQRLAYQAETGDVYDPGVGRLVSFRPACHVGLSADAQPPIIEPVWDWAVWLSSAQ